MSEAPDDLHYRLDQLRLLGSETDDPLAERLVWDLIIELENADGTPEVRYGSNATEIGCPRYVRSYSATQSGHCGMS
jgi:hypothetical protein